MNRLLLSSLAAVAAALPSTASAVLVYGLTATEQLVSFDSDTPATVTTLGTVAQPGIVDIDFSPVSGRLYGATANGDLYVIDLANASASPAVELDPPGLGANTVSAIDFNPVADRLRVFGTNDSNYRITPDPSAFNNGGTAGLVTVDGTISDTTVNLVGAAYANNFDGAATTSLYSIDSVGNNLLVHSSAPGSVPAGNFSTVTLVGSLGIDAGAAGVGFDIGQNGIAYLSNSNNLFTVNLASGATSSLGPVGGAVLTRIAVAPIPEASTGVLGLLSGALLLRRRRR